jgi:hypothetical protein
MFSLYENGIINFLLGEINNPRYATSLVTIS